MDIPFLRPRLAALADYASLIEQIDASRLYSNFGPLNTRFEQYVVEEQFDGEGSAATVCNATLGLMLAIQAVRRPGRYAVMPSFTFAATPLAAQWCGLEPYFVDVDADSWCVDPVSLKNALAHLGDAVAVVVPYATFGTALELLPYETLIEDGVPVVVDAAPALGTRCGERAFGAGFKGPVVFSLHATKTFGIGEGGLVYSGDARIVAKVKNLSNFGFDTARTSSMLGLNAKLSEYGAAVALAMLEGHSGRVSLRRDLYAAYFENFTELGLITAGWQFQALRGTVAHQFVAVAAPSGLTNTSAVTRLASQSIEARTYFSPACHVQPQFAPAESGRLTVTDALCRRIVSLPLWEDIGTQRIRRVCEALAAFL